MVVEYFSISSTIEVKLFHLVDFIIGQYVVCLSVHTIIIDLFSTVMVIWLVFTIW